MAQTDRILYAADNAGASQMEKFRSFVNEKFNMHMKDYGELYDWSVTDIESFWSSVVEFVGLKFSVPYERVIDRSVPMSDIPVWFEGMRLNFAENCLKYKDDRTALISTGEHGEYTYTSFRDLHDSVQCAAANLRKLGVAKGDRVAAYISNCPESIILMLAAASIGAIWSSTSPDFGTTGVLERFQQIEPKILCTINAARYNGKVYSHLDKVKAVVEALPQLEHVIIVENVLGHDLGLDVVPKAMTWNTFISDGKQLNTPIVFEQLPFNHPLCILFSSGTTGKPKCLVHSAGGTLLQHLKEHVIHGNLSRKDVFFQYTTTGWMMWNWLVSGLAVGMTLVLFDGSPFKPNPQFLWQMAEKLGVTVFGTSAKYIQSLEESQVYPSQFADLSKLHSIYSTGSPLKPESFDFVYSYIKKTVLLGSITGGTDIISLFCGHNSALPVHRGEIQCRCLGMAVDTWNESGQPVRDEPGDLVCTKPFVCMPVFFWNDDKRHSKYRAAYFDVFPNVWHHGDFVQINSKTGGILMLGRSDGTLNPGGVRFGSAEIYNVTSNGFPDFADTLCVGQKQGEDERVVLFVKMRKGKTLTEEHISELKTKIRTLLSPRHVPAVIMQIADIPYTINGKKVEIAVKRIISGEEVAASGQLSNPESLQLYYNLPQLQS